MSNDPTQGFRENVESAAGGIQDGIRNFTASFGSSGNAENQAPATEDVKEMGDEVTADPAAHAAEASNTAAFGQSGNPADAPASGSDRMGSLPTDNGSYSDDEVVLDDPSDVQNHVSSRDIDGDGSIDVVHSIVDGGQRVSYLDSEGEVILTDVDADHDGTFETAVITTEDNVIVAGTDVDNDGDIDTVSYADGRTGAIFQEDTIVDGQVSSSRMDFDGDGMTDMELIDENLDGHFEKAGVDSDMDGQADVVYRDIDGDGTFDYASYDSDGDGVMDTNVDANDFGASGLGDTAGFEAMDVSDDLGIDPSSF